MSLADLHLEVSDDHPSIIREATHTGYRLFSNVAMFRRLTRAVLSFGHMPHLTEVDKKGRVVRVQASLWRQRTVRFEEINRIDIREGRSVWDIYGQDVGQVFATLSGGARLTLAAGQIAELEHMVGRLREDTETI